MIATTAIQPSASAASDSTGRSRRRGREGHADRGEDERGEDDRVRRAAHDLEGRHLGVRGAALGGRGRGRARRAAGRPSRSSPCPATAPAAGPRRRGERAQARLAQPHVDAVGPEQDPRLGPDEPGQRDEHERPVAPPGQVAIGGAERQRDEHRLGGAQQRGAVEVGAQREAERGDRARQRAGQAGAEPVGEQEREHRRRAHEPHPHHRRRRRRGPTAARAPGPAAA